MPNAFKKSRSHADLLNFGTSWQEQSSPGITLSKEAGRELNHHLTPGAHSRIQS